MVKRAECPARMAWWAMFLASMVLPSPWAPTRIIQTRHWTDDAPRAIDRVPWIDKSAERIGNRPIGQADNQTRVLVPGAWDYQHQDAMFTALDNIRDPR